MRRTLLFLALAGAGLAILATLGGGFLADGPAGEEPTVSPPRPAGAAGRAPPIDPSTIDPGRGGGIPPVQVDPVRRTAMSFTEHRTWRDRVTGEKIEFPRFVVWTFHASDTRFFKDALTGDPGVECRDIRVQMFRDPESREEATALRDDPTSFTRLVKFEMQGEEGRADFLLAETPAGGGAAADRTTIVRMTKAVRITDPGQGIVIRTSDVTVDSWAGTASGSADITADLPAGVLRGRGFRMDRSHDEIEILERTELDLESLSGVALSDSPFDLGAGSSKRTIVRAYGGAVATRLPVQKGDPVRFLVRLVDRVHVEQTGGRSLDADSVELRVVRRAQAGGRGAAMGNGGRPPHAEGASARGLASDYRLEELRAEGHVLMENPQEARGTHPASLLRLSARTLTHSVPPDGPGTSVLAGDPRLEWHGLFSPSGGKAASGKVRATCRERMSFGPPGPEHPEASLAVVLQGSAVVEREDAPPTGPGERAATPDRLEAERLDLFLRRSAGRRRATQKARDAAGADAASGPDDLEVVAFTAAMAVRLSGPQLNGEAELIVGQDLNDPANRHLFAQGPGTHFEVLGLAQEGGGNSPTSPTAPWGRAAPAAMGPDGSAKGGKAGKGDDKGWVIEGIDARKDVRGRLQALARPGGAGASGGDEPVMVECGTLEFHRLRGGRLLGEDARPARVSMPAGGDKTSWLTAPSIALQPGSGLIETQGVTHAEVWTGGGAGSAAAKGPARVPDVLAVRSGSRIDVFGVQRPDADLVLRIADGGTIEVRSKASVLDRLEAGTIEVFLAQRAQEGDASPFGLPSLARPSAAGRGSDDAGGPAAMATAAGPAPTKPATAAAEQPTRLVLDCVRGLSVDPRGGTPGAGGAFGGVRSMRAEGRVVAKADDKRFFGETLAFDGETGTVRLIGVAGRPARVFVGEGDLAQRFTAPEVEFSSREGRPDRIAFHAPVSAVLHRESTDGKAKGAGAAAVALLERYELMCDGDLVIGPREAVADRKVAVRRTVRRAAGGKFGEAAILRTPRLVLEAREGGSLLSQDGSGGLAKMVAEGEGTRFDTGEAGKNGKTAAGDRIELDMRTSVVTITGKPFAYFRSDGGIESRATRYSYNFATGLWDWVGITLEFGK